MKNLYLDKTTQELFTSYEDVLAIETNKDLYQFIKEVDDSFRPFGYEYINEELILKPEKINYLGFLRKTDWMVLRHQEQLTLGVSLSLSELEYEDLILTRQGWRESMEPDVLTSYLFLKALKEESNNV
jgi:hypothetical protein